MLSMLAYFELLTQPDGSHRRRCCVRRIILTRTLAFMGCNGCRPLQGCCRRNTRRFHRQDRRKSTLQCRRAKTAFFRPASQKRIGAEIGLVFEKRLFSSHFSETRFCKEPVSVQPKKSPRPGIWVAETKKQNGVDPYCFPSSKTSRKSGDQSIRPAIGQSRYEHHSVRRSVNLATSIAAT